MFKRKRKPYRIDTEDCYTLLTSSKNETNAYAIEKNGKIILRVGDCLEKKWSVWPACWIEEIRTDKYPKRIRIWLDTGY